VNKNEAADEYASALAPPGLLCPTRLYGFLAGWEACADLCLKELGLTDGSREKLRKIRDGLPFEPVPKMREVTPDIPGN
jgi:hypothetical protein